MHRLLINFKYPKLLLLSLSVILAYFVFSCPIVKEFVSGVISSSVTFSYISVFIAGFFFSFGFTTPFAVGFFIDLNTSNILCLALLGGLGAMIADLFIFSLIKISFMNEFKRLQRTKLISGVNRWSSKSLGKKMKSYLLYVFAGIIISSPLPDELGVAILTGLGHIKPYQLAIIGFIFNSLGIFLMLMI